MGFKTKSRAIELLGRKQIRDGTTALAELLKNSFDADAQIAKAIFNTEYVNPYILLVDTGFGMTNEDITNKWLVIGTNSKKRSQRTTPNGRKLMGEKGIGRLASATLGQQLFMFTKSKKDGKWNILLIDWNIFENPYSFIQDVKVPVELNKNFLFINSLEELSKNMIEQVHSNLQDTSWFDYDNNTKEDLVILQQVIYQQLSNFNIPFNRLKNQLNFIEKKGHGTILLITNLREDWNRVLNFKRDSSDLKNDFFAEKNYTRLQTFLFPLNNTGYDFNVELFFNDKKLPLDYGFSEEDYEVYDVKIEGEVREGKFYGEIDTINSDKHILEKCNNELALGIDVDYNIPYEIKQKGDCGAYKVKLCHIEGEKRNTGLNLDLWAKQIEKLNRYGGVMIFRDGVRILPYGEPENDFIGIEKRRNLRAGYYLFAHKRLFGRIDITHNDNPLLEDKSSREGFIENEQYFYFNRTLQNLLVKIATQYINSTGIRSSYLDLNNKKYELQKREEDAIKGQKKLLKLEIKRIKNLLKQNPKELNNFINNCLNLIDIQNNTKGKLNQSQKYTETYSYYSSICKEIYNLEKTLAITKSKLKIKIKGQFKTSLPSPLLEDVFTFNQILYSKLTNQSNDICIYKKNLDLLYKFKINEWQKNINNIFEEGLDFYKNNFLNNIYELSSLLDSEESELKNKISYKKSKFNKVLKIVNKEMNSVLVTEKNLHNNIWDTKKIYKSKLEQLKERITNIHTLEPLFIKNEVDTIFKDLQSIHKKIQLTGSELDRQIDTSFENTSPKLKELGGLLENDFSVDQLIDALTKNNAALENEIEVMSDLANIGLSAEIVDHEFNQYFTNVTNAITDLKKLNLNNYVKYYLHQIDTGFRAIGNRHSQLSPMYRSYNLKKRKINVIELVKHVVDFFNFKIESSNINIIYEIPEYTEIVISPSKIYPVLSNLLDNAIYWVISGKERKIIWRYIQSENALYIEDSGPGINPRIKDQIFDKFFTQKPIGVGRGLGLTIAKKVLELQDNSIQLITETSKKKLSGACFKITFKGDK